MGSICVNRSGKAWTVTKDNTGTQVIGTIQPNEVFAWTGTWAGNHTGVDYQNVTFKGGYGWVSGASSTGFFTRITECGLYKIDWDGKNCAVFQTRRSTPYYDIGGNRVGNIPAGYYLCAQDGTAGKKNPHLMYIDAWGKTDPANDAAFIDVGYSSYPQFSNINIIGKL